LPPPLKKNNADPKVTKLYNEKKILLAGKKLSFHKITKTSWERKQFVSKNRFFFFCLYMLLSFFCSEIDLGHQEQPLLEPFP
jgi:hypothetical protein